MNSDVHRHQAHPPLGQHGVHGAPPYGWCNAPPASAAAAPTAPARLKRIQPPHHLPSVGGVVSNNGPHAPLSPTALQNSVPHNSVMSSSVRAPAPVGSVAPSVMHTSQTAPLVVPKGSSDVVVSSVCVSAPAQPTRLAGMAHMPWHHGAISRERAESLLSGSTDGTFLVRESTNFPGDHTLCVRYRGRVEHYRVKWATALNGQTQQLTIDDEEFFDNMTDLIKHYQHDADGLCTQLGRYLPKAIVNGANNNGALHSSFPPHPQQPPPYPPTPSVAAARPHFHYDQTDSPTPTPTPTPLPPQKFVDARWMIAERDLEIRENIGKGEFGDVMLGILNGSQKVAVKILKDKEAASKFLAEASLMASLKHDNLVRFLGLVFSAEGSTCLVTEHMAQGSLLDYLRSRGRHYVTQLNQINFAYDACCGMEYLERQRVVHRDLAARNVLISHDGAAKVADFGLARTDLLRPERPSERADDHAQAKLPIKWTAPEALKQDKFSNKSDMWSFGILLWEIYSFGRVPYPRIPLAEVVKHVERGYRMEAPEGCPAEMYELMRAAWHHEPSQRPAFLHAKARLATLRELTLQLQPPPQ